MKLSTLGLMAILMSFGAQAISGKSASRPGEVPSTSAAVSESCCSTCPDATLSANCLAQRNASHAQGGQSRSSNPKKARSVTGQ